MEIPVRTQGSITILGLTNDIGANQTTQPQLTRAHPTQAATILGHQRVAYTTALVTSISTMAKAVYISQFLPWSTVDLLAPDVPLNRTFRRLLHLPPTHPNALLYIGSADGGLGLPRLSDQINLRKWSILCRLHDRGGLPALAVGGLLTRAALVSGGQFLVPAQGDFIGPNASAPVWVAASEHWARTLRSPSPPHKGRSLTLFFARSVLSDHTLLRTLRRLDLSTWAELTSLDPNGTRTWLDLPLLLPEVALPSFPPVPQPWPGDPAATRPGQFWRLLRGTGDLAWGGIYQILSLARNGLDLTVQRWLSLPTVSGRAGHPTTLPTALPTALPTTDFLSRFSHRLLVLRGRCPHKGTTRADFPDTPCLTPSTHPAWVEQLRSSLPTTPLLVYILRL